MPGAEPEPPSAGIGASSPRCVIAAISGCQRVYDTQEAVCAFIETDTVGTRTALRLDCCDDVTAHTAIRHLQTTQLGGQEVLLVLTPAQRKHKAFTPWLHMCKTTWRKPGSTEPVVMSYRAADRHVHDAASETPAVVPHAASFDMRVGGKQCRVLVDSGATLSVMHTKFAHAIGAPISQST